VFLRRTRRGAEDWRASAVDQETKQKKEERGGRKRKKKTTGNEKGLGMQEMTHALSTREKGGRGGQVRSGERERSLRS